MKYLNINPDIKKTRVEPGKRSAKGIYIMAGLKDDADQSAAAFINNALQGFLELQLGILGHSEQLIL